MSWLSRDRQQRLADFVAGLIHELHRVRLPLTGAFLYPLRVKVAEALLCEIHDVFGRHGIAFWLRDGTALGVYRDGSLIHYDDDVDLGLWREDAMKLDAALAELEDSGFTVYRRNSHTLGLLKRLETIEFVVSGVYADAGGYHKLLEETFFRTLVPVSFLGREFKLPSPTEAYLEFCYGSDWRIPKYGAWWSNSVWLPAEQRRDHVVDYLRKSSEAETREGE